MLLSATMTPTFLRYQPADGEIPAASSSPSGISPATMRHAYAVDTALFGSVVGDGTGQTIAIVDAFDQPNIATDLIAFDAFYGLADPPSFTKVSQATGVAIPPADAKGGWGVEITLDVEWAHVIAPKASILLVEATSNSNSDFVVAIDRARNFAGVSVVSMSWGGDETSTDLSTFDSHFATPTNHIPITFVASSGDSGAFSVTSKTSKVVEYPASSSKILAVGGTTLTTGSGGVYVSESGWGSGTSSYSQDLGGSGGGGGGISTLVAQPSYQSGIVTQSTTKRAVPDVSMDADPNSGVPIYDSYDFSASTPWATFGGTSLAAPMWAAVIAIADQGRVLNGLSTLDGPTVTLPDIYALPASDFHDVTTGNNGFAAGTGYDLVTGRGSPIVNLLVRDLAAPPGPAIGSFTIAPSPATVGSTLTLTAAQVVELGGTISNVKFYLESNSAAGLQIGSDTLIGTGTVSGTTYTITTSTAGLAVGSYTYYAVATDSLNAAISTAAAVSLTAPVPTIGPFTISPASTTIGGVVTLTASNVAEPFGAISSVKFYMESNGISGLQTASDTFVGAGTNSGTTWTFSPSTANLALGTYTYYALATDPSNVVVSATATLTITNPVTPAVFAWDVAGLTNYGTQGFKATSVSPSAVNSLGLTRGSGVTTPNGSSSANGFGGETWGSTSSAGISANEFITFALTVSPGYSLSLASINMNFRVANSAGPTDGNWQYQINGGTFVTIGSFTNEFPASSNGGSITPINLSTIAGLQNLASGSVVTFRLTPYGGSGTHTWYILDLTGNDLVINGTSTTLSGVTPLGNFGLSSSGSAVTVNTTGPVTLNTDLQSQGAISFNVGANTQTTIDSSEHLSSLSIGTGAMVSLASVNNILLDLQTITIASTGHLDLGTNALLVSAADISALRSLLQSGQIYSSDASGTSSTSTLSYFRGADYANLFGPQATFSGQSIQPTDFLVQLAKTGDTNLDDTLNIDDYLNVDEGMLIPPATVTSLSGDLNFDGIINAADYALLDNAVNLQNNAPIQPAVFKNWTAINAAIAKVPAAAGPITANVSVINFGTLVYTGALDVTNTITRIRNDTNISGDADDGIVFTNSERLLPTNTGTWYEFQVAPSNGSNINFSSKISAPGPMRLLIDDNGDVYFTGDHYVTFVPVYLAGSTTPPTIGSFSINPASITSGVSVTLSAANVAASAGTISSVNFYLDSNGTTGLQIGSDTLIGAGTTANGTGYTISAATASLAPGSYTYYVVATDSHALSTFAPATLIVTSPATVSGLLSWDVNGQSNFGTPGLTGQAAAGVIDSLGLTRGSGVATVPTAASDTWGGNNWSTTTSAAGITGNQYVTFGLTVSPGYVLSLASIDMNARRSSSGPLNGYWQYQINGGTWTLIGDFTSQFTSTSGAPITEINLAAIAALQNLSSGTAVNIRVVPYGASTAGGNWYIDSLAGNDLVIGGSSISLTGITPLANITLSVPTPGTFLVHTTGAVTISSDLNLQGNTSLDVGANSSVTLSASEHLTSLTIAAGATVSLPAGAHLLLDLQTLAITGMGTLNLTDNSLVLHASDPLTLATFLKNGQVYSSLSIPSITSLGYLLGSQFAAVNPPGTPFAGESVQSADLLVRYTYIGDTNFDGQLTVDDLLQIDASLINPPLAADWFTGDFNFDGVVDAADYSLIQAAYARDRSI